MRLYVFSNSTRRSYNVQGNGISYGKLCEERKSLSDKAFYFRSPFSRRCVDHEDLNLGDRDDDANSSIVAILTSQLNCFALQNYGGIPVSIESEPFAIREFSNQRCTLRRQCTMLRERMMGD